MKKFAVFDIDGTLIRWQLYHAIADVLAKKGYIDAESYADMREARMYWKRRSHANSFKDYEKSVVAAYDKAVTKLTVDQFLEAANLIFEEYKDQVYTFSRSLIDDLKRKNYTLLAISGSQKEIVQLIADYYGFDDCVGSTYERKDNSFTGRKQIASQDKSTILRELVEKHGLNMKGSIAVGDTESDIPMFEMVEQPIALNPTRGLFEHAKRQGWKVVVERKNMVYELRRDKDGQYILV